MFSAHSRALKSGLFSKRTSQSCRSDSRATKNAASSSTTASLPLTCSAISSSTYLPSLWGTGFAYALRSDLDLAVFHEDLIAAQPYLRVRHALAGEYMVFQAVPGANHDLLVVDPLCFPV